ncbi:MAG: hypothetical protein ACOXZV_04815 [Bacteroidales bacterium]|jgi:hypothetical protein
MATKISFILILFFAGTAVIFSQPDTVRGSTLSLDAGYAFTGSGDLNGYCLYNEYSFPLGKKFGIAPAVGVLNFFGNDMDNTYDNPVLMTKVTCVSFGFTGYFFPLTFKIMDVETGLGFYYRTWHWAYATGSGNSYEAPGLSIGPGSHGHRYAGSPGYTVSVGTILKASPRFGISLRGVYQNDLDGDNSLTLRMGVRIGLSCP